MASEGTHQELRGSVVAEEARVEKEAADRVQATAADPQSSIRIGFPWTCVE
jgi:hypothetical protein